MVPAVLTLWLEPMGKKQHRSLKKICKFMADASHESQIVTSQIQAEHEETPEARAKK